MSLGATLDDWSHFDFVLGLSANLLPCVPAAPDVKVLEGSALAGKVGKIPSMFNGRGEAHGLLAWQKLMRSTPASEVAGVVKGSTPKYVRAHRPHLRDLCAGY